MTVEEHGIVIRHFIGSLIVAILCAVGGFMLSASGLTKVIGAWPTAFFGLVFGLSLGNKLFPDASRIITIRFRNYRRAKAGKKLIDDTDPEQEYNHDIGRG
jgi:hypothetical protein